MQGKLAQGTWQAPRTPGQPGNRPTKSEIETLDKRGLDAPRQTQQPQGLTIGLQCPELYLPANFDHPLAGVALVTCA